MYTCTLVPVVSVEILLYTCTCINANGCYANGCYAEGCYANGCYASGCYASGC